MLDSIQMKPIRKLLNKLQHKKKLALILSQFSVLLIAFYLLFLIADMVTGGVYLPYVVRKIASTLLLLPIPLSLIGLVLSFIESVKEKTKLTESTGFIRNGFILLIYFVCLMFIIIVISSVDDPY